MQSRSSETSTEEHEGKHNAYSVDFKQISSENSVLKKSMGIAWGLILGGRTVYHKAALFQYNPNPNLKSTTICKGEKLSYRERTWASREERSVAGDW